MLEQKHRQSGSCFAIISLIWISLAYPHETIYQTISRATFLFPDVSNEKFHPRSGFEKVSEEILMPDFE